MANLSNRPDSPGSSSEGKPDKKTRTHTCAHTVPSYVLEPHTYGRWLTVSDCHFKFTLLWSVKPCFRFIRHHPPSHPEPGWSQEAEEAIQSLDKQLQSEPRFQQALKDSTLPKGATARLTCHVNGRVTELWCTSLNNAPAHPTRAKGKKRRDCLTWSYCRRMRPKVFELKAAMIHIFILPVDQITTYFLKGLFVGTNPQITISRLCSSH